jgi:hypothetical protein
MPATQEIAEPRILALAAPPEGDGDVSAPFEVIRAGQFVKAGREIELTTEDLDKMVANFNRWLQIGAEVPVDYDHSFFEGGESRAAGWYTELVRKGKSLWARVRWTAKAVELIRSREYRFFSPEWTKDFVNEQGTGEGPTMLAGGLTNRPFLRGMTPVALSADAAAAAWAAMGETDVKALAEAVRAELGSEVGAGDETRGEVGPENGNGNGGEAPEGTEPEGKEPEAPEGGEGKEPEQPAGKEPEGGEGGEPEGGEAASARGGEQVTMTRAEANALRAKADEADSLKDKVETMGSQLAGVRKDLDDQHFTADFGQALREGRVDAKKETRERWAKRYEKLGRDTARELLFEMPAETIPVTERGRDGQNSEAGAAPEGVDQEAFELDQKAQAWRREHPDKSYSEALAAVEAEGASA